MTCKNVYLRALRASMVKLTSGFYYGKRKTCGICGELKKGGKGERNQQLSPIDSELIPLYKE